MTKPPKKPTTKAEREKADKALSDLLRSPDMQQALRMAHTQKELEAAEEIEAERLAAEEAARRALWNRPKPRGPHH